MSLWAVANVIEDNSHQSPQDCNGETGMNRRGKAPTGPEVLFLETEQKDVYNYFATIS